MPQGSHQGAGHGGDKDDLKRREYRDEKGQIHHHTRPYMDEHGEGATRKRQAKSGGGRGQAPGAKPGAARRGARTTVDHDEIRQWAEAHGGKPAAVARTHSGGDVGIIRIMFPDAPHSEHDALTEISWEEFFAEFEARRLALLYEARSMFSKIIGRDTAERRAHGENKAAR